MKAETHPLQQDLDFILEHSADIWAPLRNQQIFITGGTGFIGTWLVESLVWANDRLDLNTRAVLLTRNPEAFRRKAPHAANHPSIQFHRGEAATFDFPDGEFPFVIHGATEPHIPSTPEEPTANFDLDLRATHRALDFARTHGTRRFLFTSSGKAYGEQPPEITNVPEEYPGAPLTIDLKSPYGQAKHASEFVCAMYGRQFGFTTVLTRLFAFSGPHLPLDLNFAIGNFVRDVLKGGPVRIEADGTPYRSYLYAAEMAIWMWTLLTRGESRIYNVGSGEGLSIAELARAVVENTVPETRIEIARTPIAGALPSRYVPAVDRVRKEFGLRQILPLDEQIRRMYAWHQQHSAFDARELSVK
ncbi:MAG: NAD(P)-dependent oxidoreductase [Acidobacteriaceae bacterium]|nr:NAD(P)-dependent oxidoreductase [Acidobacteriaceae bacterium]